MLKIREGNKFTWAWAITRGAGPEDLSQATQIKFSYQFRDKSGRVNVTEFTKSGNIISTAFLFTGVQGIVNLRLTYELPVIGPCTVDVDAFEIVASSEEASEGGEFSMTSDMAIALQGKNAYEVWLETHEGTIEEYEAWIKKPATDAAASVQEVEQAVEQAEGLRVTAESGRVTAEGLRVTAESNRTGAELLRSGAESDRAGAESIRIENEGNREQNEGNREQAEALRVQAEIDRQTNTGTAIQNAETATQNANTATDLALEVANHPDIIQNDYWYKWNTTTDAYENTNIKAKGEPGATALVKQVTGTSETDVISQKAVSDILPKSAMYMLSSLNYTNSSTIIQGAFRNIYNNSITASAYHCYDTTYYQIIPGKTFVVEGVQQVPLSGVACLTFYDKNKYIVRTTTTNESCHEFTPNSGEAFVSFSFSIINIPNYKFYPKNDILFDEIGRINDLKDDFEKIYNKIIPLKQNAGVINAVNGIIVNSTNELINAGIPSYSIGTVEAFYDKSSFDAFGVENIIKSYAKGIYATWQNYTTIKVTKEDLINAGADFIEDNVYVSAKCITKTPATLVIGFMVVLRYGSELSYTIDTSTEGSDVRINQDNSPDGLGFGDSTTWAEITSASEKLGIFSARKFEKVRIPSTYKGKEFTGILMVLTTDLESMTVPVEQLFINPAIVVGSTINSFEIYRSIEEINIYAKYDELSGLIGNHETRILNLENEIPLPLDVFYAACGDSITNANHNGIEDIPNDDLYCPFDGYQDLNTYKRKCYAYFIAKKNRLKWANYGYGGTTLIDCTAQGISQYGFAAPAGRYTQLKAGIAFDYITIFFGWNDSYYGIIQQREIWLNNTYGGGLYYPTTPEQIGAAGFASQVQYDACNAASGDVDGVTYTGSEYFKMLFIGTINSTDIKTWYGAWNTVLPYLMLKYPLAKILLIVPYNRSDVNGPSTVQRDAVISVANKWGLAYYDFRESCKMFEENNTAIAGYSSVQNFRQSYLSADTLHPSQDGYKYIYPSIDAKLMSI